jgi:hypothetical protein
MWVLNLGPDKDGKSKIKLSLHDVQKSLDPRLRASNEFFNICVRMLGRYRNQPKRGSANQVPDHFIDLSFSVSVSRQIHIFIEMSI